MLTFAHSWLFLLLPLPLLVRWLLPPFQTARPAVRLPFFAQVAELTGGRPEAGAAIQRRSAVQGIGYVVIWCALIAALARPQWLEPPIVRVVPTHDLLLAVDLSGSMAEEDFTGKDGQKVDRLSAAKEVLDEFLTRRKGDRVGLVVFGNAAFVQVPFTEDLDVCRQLLAETVPRMAGPKTAFGDAIGLGITLFERSAVKRRVMIALTDGNDTGSQVPPAEAARIAKDKGIVIHTVAMGDPTTVGEDKLDEEALRAVAQATGGQYFFAADRASLEGIYGTLDQVETRQVETISHRPRRDLFHWPLGFATVVALTYPLASSALGTVRGRRLERRSSNQSESRYGQTPSPSTEEGRGGGEARRGSRSPSLPLPPIPTLARLRRRRAVRPFPRQGGRGNTSPAHRCHHTAGGSGMSELLGHFHFLRPLWLLALVPAALAGWLLWRQQDPRRGYGAIIAPHLLAHLVIRAGKRSFLCPEVVLLCVLPLSILALAGPSWRQEPSPFAEDQAAAIVVMKIAPSMQASDLQPSRLERAQHKLHDWLALRPGARAGLIAYSGSAHLVMPLTRDSCIVEQMAQALDPSVMPVQGEALADALKLAQQQLERAGVPGSIVVLTDSIAASQFSALASYRQAGAPPVQVLAMVGSRQAAAANGLDTGARSLDASLELVTADDSDVRRLAARATTNVAMAKADKPEARWRDEGYALVPLLALAALLWARRGWSIRWHQPLEGNS